MPTNRFKPGESGNKKGRPPGIKDRRTELRELFKPYSAELIETAVSMALSGDAAMMAACLNRICPTIRPTAEPVESSLPAGLSLADQAANIFEAARTGEITPDHATALMGLVQAQCKIKELSEMEERLTALEAGNYDKH